jgi:oligopeptide transport system substrate-binding protein
VCLVTPLLSRRRLRLVVSVGVFALALAACGGGDGGGETSGEPRSAILRVNLGAEPPSLDPGRATDVTSANVLNALMDPLVKLGSDLEPTPSVAERWEVSDDGLTVTFHLRSDAKWTNGDPLTAEDFEYSWKRTVSPELAADYAYQFYGIKGVQEYNGCAKNCDALRDKVGVTALDDATLEVQLTSPQPWFLQQMAHTSFNAVHRATVEEFGDRWTEPENIVTSGPFRLTAWEHDSSMTLEKWDGWRDAASVQIDGVEGRMIADATTAVQAFEAGEFDACIDVQTCVPTDEFERLAGTPELAINPGLGVQFIGVNVKNIPDVNQRRALALAIDRTALVENVTQAGEQPATSFTPEGMPGFDQIQQDFIPAAADLEQAKSYLEQAKDPVMSITLYANQDAQAKNIQVAVQSDWEELGIETSIKAQEWAQFLEFLGPPPNSAVDTFYVGWIGDYVDAINFLQLSQCGSGLNFSGFCDEELDRLLDEAVKSESDEERYGLYGEAEARLTGPDGAFPYIPLYWIVYPILHKTYVVGWKPNLLDQFDWTAVRIEGS